MWYDIRIIVILRWWWYVAVCGCCDDVDDDFGIVSVIDVFGMPAIFILVYWPINTKLSTVFIVCCVIDIIIHFYSLFDTVDGHWYSDDSIHCILVDAWLSDVLSPFDSYSVEYSVQWPAHCVISLPLFYYWWPDTDIRTSDDILTFSVLFIVSLFYCDDMTVMIYSVFIVWYCYFGIVIIIIQWLSYVKHINV